MLMSADQHGHDTHHKNRHIAERLEGMLGTLMVVAVVILAIGMIYGLVTTDSTPSWMR
jgi:cell division protein FtsL